MSNPTLQIQSITANHSFSTKSPMIWVSKGLHWKAMEVWSRLVVTDMKGWELTF